MSTVSHQLNAGNLGKDHARLIQSLPRYDDRFYSVNKPDTRNQKHGSIKGTDDPLRTTLGLINGGVRGVLPCVGVDPSAVMGNRVLRRPNLVDAGFMTVPQGFAKSQDRGLAYDPTKPLNVLPQEPVAFYNPLTTKSQFSAAPFRASR